MMLHLLLLLILAHLLADFVFQNDELANNKNGSNGIRHVQYKALYKHAGIHLLFNIMAGIIFIIVFNGQTSWLLLLFLIILSIIHGVIDLLKSWCSRLNQAVVFLADQLIHIILIMVMIDLVFPASILEILKKYNYSSIDWLGKFLIIVIIMVIISSLANIFIKILLEPIKPVENNSIKTSMNVGRYIGVIERVFAAFAVCSGEYSILLGFFAAKTAIRFKKIYEEDFAEYYLLGTSVSILIGIAIGICFKCLFR